MSFEVGVNAFKMERGSSWEWGKAAVVEAGWEPGATGPGRGKKPTNSLTFYLENLAIELGEPLSNLPTEQTLRVRAIAYYHCSKYQNEIAVNTAYEAATAVSVGRWDGSISELLEAARNDAGKITLDAVRKICEKSPATEIRPKNAVEKLQKSARFIAESTKELSERDSIIDDDEKKLILHAIGLINTGLTILGEVINGEKPVDFVIDEILSECGVSDNE